MRAAAVGRKALYEIGGQNAAEVHRVGLVIVQFEGIGLAIGPPARGWRGEAIEKVVKRRLTRDIGFENSIVIVIVEVVRDS